MIFITVQNAEQSKFIEIVYVLGVLLEELHSEAALQHWLLLIWELKNALDYVTLDEPARDLVRLVYSAIGNELLINLLQGKLKLDESDAEMILDLMEKC